MLPKILLIALLSLNSCVSREEVQQDIFVNETIPASECEARPALWDYGIYRTVLCKNKPDSEFCQNGEKTFEEFISYCDQAASQYLSIYRDDLVKWLDRFTRPKAGGRK